MSKSVITQVPGEDASIKPVKLQQIDEASGNGPNLFAGNLSLIRNVKVKLEAVVGQAEMSVGELFDLKSESVVKLDAATNAPIDIRLDGKVVARGHLVVVDDSLGVRIEEVLAVAS